MFITSSVTVFGQQPKATAIVNADQGTVQISRHIYGQFRNIWVGVFTKESG